MSRKKHMKKSFFENLRNQQIFSLWNSSKTLLDIAKKLGFPGETLTRADYECISKRKTREVWQKYILGINREKEKQRPSTLTRLSKEELLKVMNSDGIETVGHLALHFLVSEKHGRNPIRKRILELKLPIKDSLMKGICGVSATPRNYPKRFYEKRSRFKPMTCPFCNFQVIDARQIELHHVSGTDTGTQKKGTPEYNQTKNIQPLCANCHTLEHRTGEHLRNNCGLWKRKRRPKNLKYKNPNDIFTDPCPETYRLQKKYYIHSVLTDPSDYKCCQCGVSTWGTQQKLLSLEMNHKDGNQQNSLISNLELLCPNCHRLHTANLPSSP